MATETQPDNRAKRGLPTRLVAGLVLAIILDTGVQTVWKRAAQTIPDAAAHNPRLALASILHQPLFLAVGVLIFAQMFNWLKVLDDADVSYALPITALSYLSVALVSGLWLHEAVTPARLGGMLLILVGVALVARTDHNTLDPS
jgi:drug/metabolite transporter (DMT)-like permease